MIRLIIAITISLATAHSSPAKCTGSFLNPISEIAWQNVFPVKIATATIIASPEDSSDIAIDTSYAPVCTCPAPPPLMMRVGVPIGYYEPSHLLETVKDPFCFPSLGTSAPISSYRGKLAGTHETEETDDIGYGATSAQAHYLIFPVWEMMDMFIDILCKTVGTGMDIGYLTEVDPFWNEDKMSVLMRPETILFANPLAQISCLADSIAANLGRPLDPMFWCMGSWGATYPMTSVISNPDSTAGNAALAGRLIANLSRHGMINDGNVYLCADMPTPIWIKSNYRLTISRPQKSNMAIPIGRSTLIWGHFKNPGIPGASRGPDNFIWPLFSRQSCCASY